MTYILSATHIAILVAFKMEETFTLAAKKKKKKDQLDSGLEKPEARLHAECSVVRSLH